jgi:hypothetical protein
MDVDSAVKLQMLSVYECTKQERRRGPRGRALQYLYLDAAGEQCCSGVPVAVAVFANWSNSMTIGRAEYAITPYCWVQYNYLGTIEHHIQYPRRNSDDQPIKSLNFSRQS